jgi:putative transcriptional regulator
MATKTRKSLFERLKSGLQEGIAHAKGELTLKTIEVPEPPPEIDAKTLVALREQAKMSQGVFAKMLFVSPKTVQSWEQGTRAPSKAARRLIQIFAQRPGVVCEVVGLRSVQLEGFRIVDLKKGKRRIVKEIGDAANTK